MMLVVAIDLGGTHATCAQVRDTEVLARETLATCGSAECGDQAKLLGAVPLLEEFQI